MIDQSWLREILACPRCSGPVSERDERWHCPGCGEVGRRTLGFPDFTDAERPLAMAAGAQMDLLADEQAASEFYKATGTATAEELDELATRRHVAREDSEAPARGRRARRRFNRKYNMVNASAGSSGGEAFMVKIDSKLRELGWAPIAAETVLEAGGGQGLYVPAFAARFKKVVFVDASLTNLILASKRGAELGLHNVAYVRADVMALPFSTGQFDFVHQNGVVEHVHNPARMMEEGMRVRRPTGYYVCVSPNRMALTPEPHFRLPAFGYIPSTLRAPLIRFVRGLNYEEAGTDPRTLGDLRRYVEQQGAEDSAMFFLPRHLPSIARQTAVRRLVSRLLHRRRVGDALHWVLNDLLLNVMPYHIMISRIDPGSART